MLVADSISKRFGTVQALARVSLVAHPGEIHVLLGENGAGKTTLMNVLAGRLRPDRGTVTLEGRALRAGSPRFAREAGVGAVHQSSMLFERLSWEENLALGGVGARRLDPAGVTLRAQALGQELGFKLPPPGTLVEQLSVTERVRLEVMRALSFGPRALILDEPTGVLAPAELAGFLESLRRLRAAGRIIVLITHKLAEALAVADRVTVLREGRVVAQVGAEQLEEAALARLMVGELEPPPTAPADRAPAGARTLLGLEELCAVQKGRPVLDRLSLALRAGEIVGVAGVDGNGQLELVEVLAGIRPPSSGRVLVNAGQRARALAVIPQNRDLDGLILDMPIWENLMLSAPLRARASRRGWLDRRAAVELCAALIARFRIRAPSGLVAAAALSGGNRQRLEVARALAGAPAVVVAHNVCRGLDVAATGDVHRELRNFTAAGGAVLLISSDLDELLGLSDRMAVMSRGRLRTIADHEREPARLGRLMAGNWG